jgi:hypothetical protein
MRYLLFTGFLILLLGPVMEPAIAQGGEPFCLRLDEKAWMPVTLLPCPAAAIALRTSGFTVTRVPSVTVWQHAMAQVVSTMIEDAALV